jgi:FkbM family methyltransferase
MLIRHYIVNTPQIKPPTANSWKQAWHGYYRLAECKSDNANKKFKEAEQLAHSNGCLSEREFEVDCFLSILDEIQKDKVSLLEIGAGFGEWCLALAGVVRNQTIKIQPKQFECYAIEAEPQHKVWANEIFETYEIPGKVIWGAISDKNGECDFSVDDNSADCYGQSITFGNSLFRSIGNLARRQAIKVPCFTLDSLFIDKLKHVDIAHMDIQGAEARVIKSSIDTLKKHRIDYWIIGTHNKAYNKRITGVMLPYYDMVVNIEPRSIAESHGHKVKVQDGMQVWKRKNM